MMIDEKGFVENTLKKKYLGKAHEKEELDSLYYPILKSLHPVVNVIIL